MGNSLSEQWNPPTDLYIIMDYKYCRVWVRKSDKVQHMEEYQIHIDDESELRQYKKMFAMRIDQSQFVSTLYFAHKSSTALCGQYETGSILLQRIPYRLCQFSNIPYFQTVSILAKCLKSFAKLSKIFGLFMIRTTMIGINHDYLVKVWHHTDFSMLKPENPYCKTLTEMIHQIIDCIESISDPPYACHSFRQYISVNSLYLFNFESALKYLDCYCNENSFVVKHKFDRIQRFLKEAEGIIPITTHRQLKKNSSSEKFSFKTNRIVRQDSQIVEIESESDLRKSTGSNTSSRANKYGSKTLNLRVKQPTQNHHSKDRSSNASISDYGIKGRFVDQASSQYTRVKLKMKEDETKSFNNSHFSGTRATSQATKHNQPKQSQARKNDQKTKQRFLESRNSPYYQSISTKSLKSAESFSFIEDTDIRQDYLRMLGKI